jgi:hypothetical protein
VQVFLNTLGRHVDIRICCYNQVPHTSAVQLAKSHRLSMGLCNDEGCMGNAGPGDNTRGVWTYDVNDRLLLPNVDTRKKGTSKCGYKKEGA